MTTLRVSACEQLNKACPRAEVAPAGELDIAWNAERVPIPGPQATCLQAGVPFATLAHKASAERSRLERNTVQDKIWPEQSEGGSSNQRFIAPKARQNYRLKNPTA